MLGRPPRTDAKKFGDGLASLRGSLSDLGIPVQSEEPEALESYTNNLKRKYRRFRPEFMGLEFVLFSKTLRWVRLEFAEDA